MTFTALDYFAVVAREKNITRAAKKLNITQQTLSSQIKKLEEELGCTLLIRHVPLELTYAGQKLLDYSNSIHTTMESLYWDFNKISGNDAGIIRIGIAHARGLVLLPEIIQAFRKEYPHYSFAVTSGSNQNSKKNLYDENVHVIIGELDEFSRGMQVYPLYRERIIYAGLKSLVRNDMEALKDKKYSVLQKYPFLLCNIEDIAGRIGRLFLSNNNLRPTDSIEVNNLAILLAMCIKGMGICLCPEYLLKNMLTKEQLDTLFIGEIDEDAEFQISMGILKKNINWEPLLRFIEIAKKMTIA